MEQRLFLTVLILFLAVSLNGCAAFQMITGDSDPESERQEWRDSYQERLQNAYRSRDVALGMDMTQVQHIWGAPGDVESAGSGQEGNARWTYYEGLSNSSSISRRRIIYFEEGQVIGWETAQR